MLTPKLNDTFHGVPSARKRSSYPSKSAVEHEISNFLLEFIGGYNIPTSLVQESRPEVEFRPLVMIPLEISVWNTAVGEYAKHLGLKDGYEMTIPVIEHRLKRPDLGTPLLNEFHIYSLGLATPEQLRQMNRIAAKANIVLRSFFERRELRLDKLGLEFGLYEGQIMIGEEISPRNCLFTEVRNPVNGGRSKEVGS